jgi:glucose-1-phosphate thymidylyltransferase
MKGIILAGGRGTRLFPVTVATCKQLLPVYDKPLIYYPLATLMQAGIREILIISTPEDEARFQALFHDGSDLGLEIYYKTQAAPRGIAEAFLIGADFIGTDSVALILGDNIFYGHRLSEVLRPCTSLQSGAIIFGYEVHDPERYGVIAFDDDGHVKDILEKPKIAPSPYAVTGLYFYDHTVVDIASNLRPSPRGELEITDVNVAYLRQHQLQVRLFERGFAWLDTGTHDALHKAATYVQTLQERQGIKIACLEEIAYLQGFISLEKLHQLAAECALSEYGHYLRRIEPLNPVKATD